MAPRSGDRKVVNDVEHRDRDDRGDVEPQCYLARWLIAFRESEEEIDRKDNPNERDGDINRPDQLGILFTAGHASGQSDGCGHDDQLPAPKVDAGQKV